MVDEDGNRTIYLDVTSLSGASENGFEIWAGPPVYTATLPGDVNQRNVQVMNNHPEQFDSKGISVLAVGQEPQNSNLTGTVDIPLAYIGSKYAGQVITVTLFDPDQGTRPPLAFYFDTLSPAHYYLSFGDSVDPAGRCFDGGSVYAGECDDQWVTPAYTMTIPEAFLFYGGRLMAQYEAGTNDTLNWKVTLPPAPAQDVTAGCWALPIAVHQDNLALFPSDATVTPPYEPFPLPAEFEYPDPPPTYTTDYTDAFFRNTPGLSLTQARQGYIFKANKPVQSDFTFLCWRPSCDANALITSLIYPGDSYNYVNPNDFDDTELNVGDWVLAHSGNVGSLDALLSYYIDRQAPIRLIIYDAVQSQGSEVQVKISGFAVLQLQGFSFYGVDKWLLLEYVQGENGCGRPVPPGQTPTPTPSATSTSTPTSSPTPSPPATPTATPSATSTPTYTPSATATPTTSPTATPTATATATQTPTSSPTPSPSPPPTATPTATSTPARTPTPTNTPQPGYRLYLPVVRRTP